MAGAEWLFEGPVRFAIVFTLWAITSWLTLRYGLTREDREALGGLSRRLRAGLRDGPMSDNPVLAYGRWLAEAPADWPDAAWAAAHRAFHRHHRSSIPGAAEPVTRRVFATVE